VGERRLHHNVGTIPHRGLYPYQPFRCEILIEPVVTVVLDMLLMPTSRPIERDLAWLHLRTDRFRTLTLVFATPILVRRLAHFVSLEEQHLRHTFIGVDLRG
jgi:hypothetical protein